MNLAEMYLPVLLACETFFLLLLILDFSLLKLVRILKFKRRRNVKGKTPENIFDKLLIALIYIMMSFNLNVN